MGGRMSRRNGPLPPWGVRPYVRGDLAHLPASTFSAEEYAWRFLSSPAAIGVPNVWYADTGEKLVGHYASIPQPFQLGDQRLHILQGEQSWQAGGYAQQPVVREIAAVAVEAWRAADVPFVWRLREGATPPSPLETWQQLQPCTWLWRPLRLGAYLRQKDQFGTISALGGGVGSVGNLVLRSGLRWRGRRITVAPVGHVDERFDHLWNVLSTHYQALTIRDRAWLDYRYRQGPVAYQLWLASHNDVPTGYIATRLLDYNGVRSGVIVDLFTAPRDDRSRNALLRTAMDFFVRAGALAMRLLVLRKSYVERWFRRRGFLRESVPSYVTLLPLRSDMPHPLMRDEARWHLMVGDFDLL